MPGRFDLTLDDLGVILAGEPPYRVRQVWRHLYQGREPEEMTDLPLALRSRLAGELVSALRPEATSVNAEGDTTKWLWSLEGGARVETVLMTYPSGRVTVCVSTQAGCAMACTFCATGQAGFERQLTPGEIVEQVIRARRHIGGGDRAPDRGDGQGGGAGAPAASGGLPPWPTGLAGPQDPGARWDRSVRVAHGKGGGAGVPAASGGRGPKDPGARWDRSVRVAHGKGGGAGVPAASGGRGPKDPGARRLNIVFMGMGEPLANYPATWAAVERLHFDVGLSARHLTVSTVGIVPGILRLAEERLPVNLAVSLHAANDELRDTLVPINRRYPLTAVVEACQAWVASKHRRLSFEWALIDGVNDRPSDAAELARLARPLAAHVNLIPLNPTPGYLTRGTPAAGVRAFRDRLVAAGVNATIRRNRGTDIAAACGQLAGAGQPPSA